MKAMRRISQSRCGLLQDSVYRKADLLAVIGLDRRDRKRVFGMRADEQALEDLLISANRIIYYRLDYYNMYDIGLRERGVH